MVQVFSSIYPTPNKNDPDEMGIPSEMNIQIPPMKPVQVTHIYDSNEYFSMDKSSIFDRETGCDDILKSPTFYANLKKYFGIDASDLPQMEKCFQSRDPASCLKKFGNSDFQQLISDLDKCGNIGDTKNAQCLINALSKVDQALVGFLLPCIEKYFPNVIVPLPQPQPQPNPNPSFKKYLWPMLAITFGILFLFAGILLFVFARDARY